MPSIEEGITTDAEPKHDVNTDEGFRRHLEEKVKDLPAHVNDWGAPSSTQRRARMDREMADLEKAESQKIRSKEDLHRFMVADNQGDWRSGIEVPNDEPTPEPAPVADTAEVERLQKELTAARGSLTEAQAWEATQVARDDLEEAESETDVHTTLAELRGVLSPDAWGQFTMESLGDQLITAEEYQLHNQLWDSEQAYGAAEAQAQKAQKDADELAKFQYEVLAGEQKRLGLSDEAYTLHLQDIVEAVAQLGYDFNDAPKEEYASRLRELSALVAEGRRAYKHAAIQEAIMGAPSGSVEEGLTIRGEPVSPREEIEPTLDYNRLLAHQNIGKKVDVAAGVLAEDQKSRSLGDEAAAVYRAAVRASEAKEARARRAGF